MDNTANSDKSKQTNDIRVEKLDIQRAQDLKLPYTIISSLVIRQIKNPLAGFIWIFLQSLPPNWIVIKEQIKNKFDLGDNTLKKIFSYLNRCSLIAYERERVDGKLGEIVIKILDGTQFKSDEPYVSTRGSKNAPVVKTTGSITRRLENHTSGSGALQIQDKNKSYKNKKTRNAFDEKKNSNEPKQLAQFWEPGNPDYDRVHGKQ